MGLLAACGLATFQFHIGSIQAGNRRSIGKRITIVSIPHWFDSSVAPSLAPSFPSKVSIPHWFDSSISTDCKLKKANDVSIPHWFDSSWFLLLSARCVKACFNSTLVRFKRSHQPSNPRPSCLFQFHIGSIQAPAGRLFSERETPRFNSTLVRFKLAERCNANALKNGFNSTLVRFKLFQEVRFINRKQSFQFHIGSIQAQASSTLITRMSEFQFHIGSIQAPVCRSGRG